MKNKFDELIFEQAKKYHGQDDGFVHSDFQAGAKFVSENPMMIPAVAEMKLQYDKMLEWIYANHEMPGYSEMIYDAELALKNLERDV